MGAGGSAGASNRLPRGAFDDIGWGNAGDFDRVFVVGRGVGSCLLIASFAMSREPGGSPSLRVPPSARRASTRFYSLDLVKLAING